MLQAKPHRLPLANEGSVAPASPARSRASKEPAASPPVSQPAGDADVVNKAAVHSDIMRAVKVWWPRKGNGSLVVGSQLTFWKTTSRSVDVFC